MTPRCASIAVQARQATSTRDGAKFATGSSRLMWPLRSAESFGGGASLQSFAGGFVFRALVVETQGHVGRAIGDDLRQPLADCCGLVRFQQPFVGQEFGEVHHQALARSHRFRSTRLGFAAPRHAGTLPATPELHLPEALDELPVRAQAIAGQLAGDREKNLGLRRSWSKCQEDKKSEARSRSHRIITYELHSARYADDGRTLHCCIGCSTAPPIARL